MVDTNKIAERAMELYYEGQAPLATATMGKYGCGILELKSGDVKGVMLNFYSGDKDPIPSGMWMDQPEEEWEGLGLSKVERAQLECEYQLKHYVGKQYWFLKKQWQGTLTKKDVGKAIKERIFPK